MTRDERIAAGWERWWGVFDWADEMWLARDGVHYTTSTKPGARWLSSGLCAADAQAGLHPRATVQPRSVWRRKKPKAPPPLKVGDEVVVRGRVHNCEPVPWDDRVPVRAGDETLWVKREAVERVRP